MMALAQEPTGTTTCTTTQTLTKTITLKRVAATYAANSTSYYLPTGTGASASPYKVPTTATGAPVATKTINSGAAALGAANVAVLAVGGAVVAMLF